MLGNIDVVTPEGVVEGWCWDPDHPSEGVAIIIAVDGVEAGRVVANLYRQDLDQAGLGDGKCAFRHVLPFGLLDTGRSHSVTIIDAASGAVVGGAYQLHSQRVASFDDRLNTLESRAALLEGRIAELRFSQVSDVSAGELFGVVGAFFERLARSIENGEAVKPERQLTDGIRALRKTYLPIAFPVSASPALSIVVDAGHDLNKVHACLSALQRATADIAVDVTVLDNGAYEEIALLPSLVRGIRYIRTTSTLVSEWADVERDRVSPFLMVLNGQATVDESALDALLDWFAGHPHAGVVGSCVVDQDGTLLHSGFCRFDDRLEDCAQADHADRRVDLGICHPVHAVSSYAAVIRRRAFSAVGGFDSVFGNDMSAALVDLCFRLGEAGWSVVSEPRANFELPAGSDIPLTSPALIAPSPAGDVLSARWLQPSVGPAQALVAGVAAVVAHPGAFSDELEAVHHLRDANFKVVYITGPRKIGENGSRLVNNAGATMEMEIAKNKDLAPDLIFLAADDAKPGNLPEAARKARIVSGLDRLRRLLSSNVSFAEAGR